MPTPRYNTGRGVEFTYEAIVEMLRQRFPNLLDWDARTYLEVDDIGSRRTIGFYFIGHGDEDREANEIVAFPPRRVAEGAPIPVAWIVADRLVLEDGQPRCGYFDGRWEPTAYQCTRHDGHTGNHLPRGR